MHGHEGENLAIRARVIEEMRSAPDNYKGFLAVDPTGVGRRNPKRKNKAGASDALQATPTEAQIEAAWQDHLSRMSKSGCYGDNAEIVAFTKAYNMDVLVFSYNSCNYLVKAAEDDVKRPVLYIALHVSMQTDCLLLKTNIYRPSSIILPYERLEDHLLVCQRSHSISILHKQKWTRNLQKGQPSMTGRSTWFRALYQRHWTSL